MSTLKTSLFFYSSTMEFFKTRSILQLSVMEQP